MSNETRDTLEEIRWIEEKLGGDLGRGRDFPTRNPATGQWQGVTPPERPTRRRPAQPASVPIPVAIPDPYQTVALPDPRPITGPRRRLPVQSLPTIDEVHPGTAIEGGPAPPPRLPGLASAAQPAPEASPLPLPPPPLRLPPPTPEQLQQQSTAAPGPATQEPARSWASSDSSDYGVSRSHHRGGGNTRKRLGCGLGLRWIFCGVFGKGRGGAEGG